MESFGVFDIIGPRMVGPSSSHTAGAARIGYMARKIAGGEIKEADVYLYGSFATTGKGHGTDKALCAGLLGLTPDDDRLRCSMLLAQEAGVEIRIHFSDEVMEHPNTARIRITDTEGKVTEVVGASIGGGNIRITELNGMPVEFSGDYPTLIVRHRDVPGVINHVTLVLAKEKVNIAFMQVFRHVRNLDAYMIIETDSPVSQHVCELIQNWSEEVTEVKSV